MVHNRHFFDFWPSVFFYPELIFENSDSDFCERHNKLFHMTRKSFTKNIKVSSPTLKSHIDVIILYIYVYFGFQFNNHKLNDAFYVNSCKKCSRKGKATVAPIAQKRCSPLPEKLRTKSCFYRSKEQTVLELLQV